MFASMTDAAYPIETVDFSRLIAAGIEQVDVLRIARDAAVRFDKNRKPFGSPSGVLGTSGCSLYQALAEGQKAFAEYQPYTTKKAADLVAMSQSAIGAAANRLIEHGFMERRRNGRSFEYRVLIPKTALVECANHYLAADQPGTLWYEYDRPLGEKLKKMLADE